jgi:hypothetical protein
MQKKAYNRPSLRTFGTVQDVTLNMLMGPYTDAMGMPMPTM